MKTLMSSIKITVAFCVILFVGYVAVLSVFAWGAMPNRGEAEVVESKGVVVGGSNVGQTFTQQCYFWGRPSAVEYNGSGSGGSNMSSSNSDYLAQVEERVEALLEAHPYLTRGDIPSELVTASGSGLDPHLSPEAVRVQVGRVAEARGVRADVIAKIVEGSIHRPMVGKPYVNVLQLNVALDNEIAN